MKEKKRKGSEKGKEMKEKSKDNQRKQAKEKEKNVIPPRKYPKTALGS